MSTRWILISVLLLTLSSVSSAFSGSDSDDRSGSQISFVPHGLLFRPLLANTYEPRVGILSQLGKNLLRLDIGNSIDLLRYSPDGDNSLLTMGADFFTYTLLRGEENFRFPVDATDYFFGINFNYKRSVSFGSLSSRLRLSHISAHLVDGHYDNTNGEWKDLRYPLIYSREFLDGVVACEPASMNNALRAYVGAIFLIHVVPQNLARLTSYAGAEWHHDVQKSVHCYVSYQATAIKISELSLRHNIQLGGKIGDWSGRGLNAYMSYFSGYSIHGEYFDVKENYFALGFLLEF
jgi:hypothetical protein